MSAGSIQGAGTYLLGSEALTVGLNNLSTEVAGPSDGGPRRYWRLTDQGRHGNADVIRHQYLSGGTNLNGGILAVNGDGNLGTGPLSFNGGTLEALACWRRDYF